MRVLWVSMNASLYDSALKRDSYGGNGWISSLQEYIKKYSNNVDLAVTFLYPNHRKKVKIDNVTYYPIKERTYNGLAKLFYYWKGYKEEKYQQYIPDLQNVISDFKPDIIHVWGVENLLGSACTLKEVPVVAHLQGFLSLYIYTYYPYGMNSFTFKWKRFSIREWFFNNGFIFNEHRMRLRTISEKQNLKSISNVMGRTNWDKKIALYNNPKVNYYHINEVLRAEYYNSPKWRKSRTNKFIIFSTISETPYKGFDLILKTASCLIEYGFGNFEWHVAGVYPSSNYTKIFESHCKIKSEQVNIKLLGALPPTLLIHECLNSDLYIHPSYIDNSPNSLCEAQFLGLPIIATNVGGVSSLVENDQTGQLVPPNAPVDLAIAIKDCFENEKKWKDMAKKGLFIAQERHNPQTIVNDLQKAYIKIINKTEDSRNY